MKMHDILDDEARERAALYALTSLTAAEAITYEAHLAICEVCRREVAQLREASLGLALLAPEETPPPNLREEVLARFRSERGQSKNTRIAPGWADWYTDVGKDRFYDYDFSVNGRIQPPRKSVTATADTTKIFAYSASI